MIQCECLLVAVMSTDTTRQIHQNKRPDCRFFTAQVGQIDGSGSQPAASTVSDWQRTGNTVVY
jgi:hypothetical protein